MKNIEIKSIGVWPLARISFLVLAVAGLFLGMFYYIILVTLGSVFSSLIGTEIIGVSQRLFSAMFGILFSTGIAVFYALFGTFFIIVIGLLYNFFAGLTGGLVVSVKDIPVAPETEMVDGK